MKIISNEKSIRRYRKLGKYTTYASLAILSIGLLITFYWQEQILLSWIAILLGFLTSQIGIYFSRRFGKSPIPHESLSAALKGLDDRYTLYHYSTQISHLLVGPSGIHPLLPYPQTGRVEYQPAKKQYKHVGGNALLKLFGQEGLGRPINDAQAETQEISAFLEKNMDTSKPLPVESILVFTGSQIVIDNNESPVPAMAADKLKDYIRKKSKQAVLNQEQINRISALYPDEDII